MAKRAAKAELSMTDRILEATGIEAMGDGETGKEFILRVCEALADQEKIDDTQWDALDADVQKWADDSIKKFSAGKLEDIEPLDGVSATDDGDEGDEGDPEPEPEPEPAPARRGRRTAAAAPEAAPTPARRGRKPAVAAAPEPAPARRGRKPAAVVAPEPTPAPARRGRKPAAVAAPVATGRPKLSVVPKGSNGTSSKPVKVEKVKVAKAKGTPGPRGGTGGTYDVVEIVCLNPNKDYDGILALSKKKGVEIADSQVKTAWRLTHNVLNALKKHDLLVTD